MEIISPLTIYLWTRLDSLFIFALLVMIPSILLGCVGLVAALIDEDEDAIRFLKNKVFRWILCVSVSLVLFLPSKSDFAMMYVVPKLANSEVIQKEASDIYSLAKEALRESLDLDDEE